MATAFWGCFACVVAVYASSLGSLIEVVNRFGSFFYGSILGVFMLAILTRRANGHRRVRGPHCRDERGRRRGVRQAGHLISLAQRHRRVVVFMVGMAISLFRVGPSSLAPAPS